MVAMRLALNPTDDVCTQVLALLVSVVTCKQ
jgi:hypothetical protein